jgi:hypothetical protein
MQTPMVNIIYIVHLMNVGDERIRTHKRRREATIHLMDEPTHRASEHALFVRHCEARLDQRTFCRWS